MPLSWVKVVRNDGGGAGDSVYIDANYVDVAGFVGQPLATDSGQHTFETLDVGDRPAWRKVATIDPPPGNGQDDPVIVTLTPVRRRPSRCSGLPPALRRSARPSSGISTSAPATATQRSRPRRPRPSTRPPWC